MTLANEIMWRDWLAGLALSGDTGGFPEDRARRAYKVADAMIDASKLCTRCYDRPRFDSHLCENCERDRIRDKACGCPSPCTHPYGGLAPTEKGQG